MDRILLTPYLSIAEDELDFQAIRSQGAGGQNVNKVSSAVQMRFDIRASSLPEECKQRLLCVRDDRLSKDGVFIIKAQAYRSQLQNKQAAVDRLRDVVGQALAPQRARIATKPSYSSRQKRMEHKRQRSDVKSMRRTPMV